MAPRQKILDVLESVRPAILADGGDVELVDFDPERGLVRVRLTGACETCPISMRTLRDGLEHRIRAAVPEVREVAAV